MVGGKKFHWTIYCAIGEKLYIPLQTRRVINIWFILTEFYILNVSLRILVYIDSIDFNLSQAAIQI